MSRLCGTLYRYLGQLRPMPSIYHVTWVTPSERFPSSRNIPNGSLVEWIKALLIALQMASWSLMCRVILTALLWQARPCSPLASINFPQGHVCGSHRLHPSLTPTASLISSLDILSPTDVIGGARSQSPACGCLTASSLAFSSLVDAFDIIIIIIIIIIIFLLFLIFFCARQHEACRLKLS